MIQPFALKCPQTSVMPEGVEQKLKTLRLSLTLPFKHVFTKLGDSAYKSFCHCYEKGNLVSGWSDAFWLTSAAEVFSDID